MYKDLLLISSPEQLFEKRIFLYGAGYEGEQTLRLLRMIKVYPEGFVDSDLRKTGKMLGGIIVLSFDEIMKITSEDEEVLIIISSAASTGEIYRKLEKAKCSCKFVYTLFSLFFCIYFNKEKLFKNDLKIKTLCDIFFETWKLRWGKLYATAQGDLAYKAMYTILTQKDDTPILIDQPGKVGSHTIKYTLENEGIDYIHFHGFSYTLDFECPKAKDYLRNYLAECPKIKIITLIREPISKDIGHFFQKISIKGRDFIWFAKGLIERNLEESFLNYLSVVTPLDFTRKGREEYIGNDFCHIDYIGERSPYGATWGFYEEEFRGFWGVDLLEYDFDFAKGYSIIDKDNIEILVIRLDKLNGLENVLGDFLELGRPVNLVNENIASEKDYGRAYNQFKEEIILPQEYIDFYYRHNKYTEHFFSEEEREQYINRWKHKEK